MSQLQFKTISKLKRKFSIKNKSILFKTLIRDRAQTKHNKRIPGYSEDISKKNISYTLAKYKKIKKIKKKLEKNIYASNMREGFYGLQLIPV